jgi:hypothetical protein
VLMMEKTSTSRDAAPPLNIRSFPACTRAERISPAPPRARPQGDAPHVQSRGGQRRRRPATGVAAGGTRRGLTLWRSALRADFAALLGLGSASQNSLRALKGPPFKQLRRASLRSAQARPPPDRASQPPQRSPPPGTACREVAQCGVCHEHQRRPLQRRGRAGRGASITRSASRFV